MPDPVVFFGTARNMKLSIGKLVPGRENPHIFAKAPAACRPTGQDFMVVAILPSRQAADMNAL